MAVRSAATDPHTSSKSGSPATSSAVGDAKFRSELTLAAEIIAGGFTARMAISGVLGLGNAFASIAVNIRGFMVAWQAMQFSLNAINVSNSIGQIGGLTAALG